MVPNKNLSSFKEFTCYGSAKRVRATNIPHKGIRKTQAGFEWCRLEFLFEIKKCLL